MKLECLQENLAEGLSVVGRVVPTKSTLPVLSNVLLSTRDGEPQLTANNLELSVAHRVPAAVEREGEITLPARLVSDYVALLDHGQKVCWTSMPKPIKSTSRAVATRRTSRASTPRTFRQSRRFRAVR